MAAMAELTDPDDREEAWRLYEGCRIAMCVLATAPDARRRGSWTLRKIRSFYPVVRRLERRWGFRQQDVELP